MPKRGSGGKSKNKGDRKNFGKKTPKKKASPKKPKRRARTLTARRTREAFHRESLEGILRIGPKGRGFVAVENPPIHIEGEVSIEPAFLATALSGDRVRIKLQASSSDELQGEVVEVLERARHQFVGRLEQDRGQGSSCFLVPDDRRVYKDIFIPRESLGKHARKACDGLKAVVEITRWRSPHDNPEGRIIEVLGKPGDHEVEIASILISQDIDYSFPKSVLKEAKALHKHYNLLLSKEARTRRDMRDAITFTIDPGDAKDFDDALSVRKIFNDVYEIGIHIADVSFFVPPGSEIDKEAAKRANSVYLVDRTIPMLPEELSADICSLKPQEDRLAYSVVLTVHEDGTITDRWMGHSVIHSNKRFTYEEAQKVLDTGKGPFFQELTWLNQIGQKIRDERFKEGSIAFETDEVKVTLDKKKQPIKIEVKERIETQMLIEEYMLLANREVATYLGKQSERRGGGSLYRVHALPSAEKILELETFVSAMGYDLVNKNGEVKARDINNLLRQIEGKPEEELIQTAVLRSMAKAIYSTKNIGHFGIGFGLYTHFTSPIRRYADLLVHRALDKYLAGKKLTKQEFATFGRMAEHISRAERDAERAERESIKFKQAQYMAGHVGKTFNGTISGVVEWGIYVEENLTKTEGLVPMRELTGDYYRLDEKNFQITGEATGKTYRLGDKVKIKVVDADPERRQITYKLV